MMSQENTSKSGTVPAEISTGETETSLQRSHVLVVLGIGLAMRLLVLWVVVTRYPPKWLFTRGTEMGLIAQSLLAGEGFSSPFGVHTGPTALVAPVYPLLVAMAFKIFGVFSPASAIAILSVQIASNLFTIWLIMHIAHLLFNQTAATVSGMVWASSLPLAWMPTILWETCLSCCLLIALVAFVLRLNKRSSITRSEWVILGASCGFSGLLNPALLPSVVALALWIVYQHRKSAGRVPLFGLVAALLVLSPWPLRNARVFHAFIPTRTTLGFELWMGNRENASGYLEESLFPTSNQSELADYTARGELDYSHRKSVLALAFIRQHPAAFLRLTSKRAFRFWTGSGTRDGSIVFTLHALFTTFAGVMGLVLLIRSRRYAVAVLCALPLALFPLPYFVTHAEFRYRLVIDALLTVLSGHAVTTLYSFLIRGRHVLPPQQSCPVLPSFPDNGESWGQA